jgi:hypothetical protein
MYRVNIKKLKEAYRERTGYDINETKIVELLKDEGCSVYLQQFTKWRAKLPKIVTVLKTIEDVTGVDQSEFVEKID